MWGVIKGGALGPPLELNYITFSPSRTVKVRTISYLPYGRGQGVGTAKLAHPAGEWEPPYNTSSPRQKSSRAWVRRTWRIWPWRGAALATRTGV